MNECMHAWTDCCLCVCLCMCMWLGGSVYLFAGWSSLHLSRTRNLYELQFHNSNSAGDVSLEEEHVDDMKYTCLHNVFRSCHILMQSGGGTTFQ